MIDSDQIPVGKFLAGVVVILTKSISRLSSENTPALHECPGDRIFENQTGFRQNGLSFNCAIARPLNHLCQ